MNKELEHFYTFIPHSLHHDVDTLLFYVINFPYQRPKQCPYCGSYRFAPRNQINTAGCPRYTCSACRRNFSQLTGSYFTNALYIEKWPDFIRLRFSGMSLERIAKQLNVSKNVTINRDKVLLEILHDKFPELYTWWTSHQMWQDHSFPPSLELQKEQFVKWLKIITETQTIKCPSCGSSVNRLINPRTKTTERPFFLCHKCKTSINLLKGTELFRLGNITIWLAFANLLLEGENSKMIAKRLNISHTCLVLWRKRFINQMEILKLNDLVRWLKWQHNRNFSSIIKKRRRRSKQKPNLSY